MDRRMKALIVAAGRGTRLRPHTDTLPKCLVPFAGRRLLDWQLQTLRRNGIDDIHVVTGYRAEALADQNVTLWHNPEWADTNMVYSMMCARPVLENADEILVCYADIVYEPRVLRSVMHGNHRAHVVVDTNWLALWQLRNAQPLDDAESLRLDAHGRIIDIGQPVATVDEVKAQYIGLMRFHDTVLKSLIAILDDAKANDRPVNGRPFATCYMTDLLQAYIDGGGDVHPAAVDSGWLEFDTTDDLHNYTDLLHHGGLTAFLDLDTMS